VRQLPCIRCKSVVLTCTPAVRPGRSIRRGGCTVPDHKFRMFCHYAERFRSTGPCNHPDMCIGTCQTRSCTCPTDGSRSVPDCCIRRDLYVTETQKTVHGLTIFSLYSSIFNTRKFAQRINRKVISICTVELPR